MKTLTRDQKLILLAEYEGWRSITPYRGTVEGIPPYDGYFSPMPVPDYLNDLNAIQEIVMKLGTSLRDLYNDNLVESLTVNLPYSDNYDFDAVINATAEQRAAALIKTLKLCKRPRKTRTKRT